MSGGVDSSLSAALLKKQGYDVTGVYMKNWSRDLPGMKCPWRQDYTDAKRVAVQLGIPFEMYDFEKQYRSVVVDYMLRSYQAGLTPNPDIMCNQEIKFGLFFDLATKNGADFVATGHYARTLENKDGSGLYEAVCKDKDQSYFLYRVNYRILDRVLMPIGEFETKEEVRKLAAKYGLSTAEKPDSQGICFVGEIGIKDFLLEFLGPQPSGDIIDQSGRIVGRHDGSIFYTIGQRHGLDLGGGLPFYVTGKDVKKNIVYVTTDLQDRNLWSRVVKIKNLHWLSEDIPKLIKSRELSVRTRYRSAKVACRARIEDDSAVLELEDEVRALTPGQSAVIYLGEQVLGGGIIY